MSKTNGNSRGKVVRHKEGAEWLTWEICDYYMDKAKNIRNRSMADGEFAGLCKELMTRCDVTEVQAINILNGYHFNEYIRYHELLRDPNGLDKKKDSDSEEYLEWLAEKEDKGKQLDDYSIEES